MNFLLFYCIQFEAFDQHLNMVLGEVEETITTIEIDEETFEQIYRVNRKTNIIYSIRFR